MPIVTTSQYPINPVTGTFGTGNIRFFVSSGTWVVPAGIGKVRARMWGGGGGGGGGGAGGGGGFSLITVYNLYGVTSIPVTVGAGGNTSAGGTSSFGSYASATGGSSGTAATFNSGGSGSNGDINTIGGAGQSSGGGGVASLFGNGGNGAASSSSNGFSGSGGAGGGAGASTTYQGGTGLFTSPSGTLGTTPILGINALSVPFSIDFLGTGPGGAASQALLGGGAIPSNVGSFPGGGGGSGTAGLGAQGLVIVEW